MQSLDFVSTTGDILLNSLLLSGGNYTTASTQEGSISASASTMNFFDASAPYGGIFLAEVCAVPFHHGMNATHLRPPVVITGVFWGSNS